MDNTQEFNTCRCVIRVIPIPYHPGIRWIGNPWQEQEAPCAAHRGGTPTIQNDEHGSYEYEYEACSNMFNHLGSLSLHKFTILTFCHFLSLSVTFCHFLPWFSTMYLLELPLTPCQLRSPVPQVGIGSSNHGSQIHPSKSYVSSPISNYIICNIYTYIYIYY